jgi:hypothetical protein
MSERYAVFAPVMSWSADQGNPGVKVRLVRADGYDMGVTPTDRPLNPEEA